MGMVMSLLRTADTEHANVLDLKYLCRWVVRGMSNFWYEVAAALALLSSKSKDEATRSISRTTAVQMRRDFLEGRIVSLYAGCES